MTTNKSKKPQLQHLDKSMTVNGKWTKEHTQAVKAADRIFNSPTSPPKPPPSPIKRPNPRKKK